MEIAIMVLGNIFNYFLAVSCWYVAEKIFYKIFKSEETLGERIEKVFVKK